MFLKIYKIILDQMIIHRSDKGLLLFLSLFIFATISALLFILIIQNEGKLTEAEETRHRLYLLADQLRQTSDDLTRMARLHVVTKEPKYKEYFQDILDIRDGIKARPQNYYRIYWDFYISTGKSPRVLGEAVPLQDLIKQERFTEEELLFLQEAENTSNQLVEIERQAMEMVSEGSPELETARQLLHDSRYNKVKENIMRPLDNLFELVEKRTTDTLNYYRMIRTSLEVAFIITLCLLFISFAFISNKILEAEKKKDHRRYNKS